MIIENLDDIEMFLQVHLNQYENDKFVHNASYKGNDDESYRMTFEQMIEELAPIVEQYLADEDFDWQSEMPKIPESQWNTWLAEFEEEEPHCCNQGCKRCLGTEW